MVSASRALALASRRGRACSRNVVMGHLLNDAYCTRTIIQVNRFLRGRSKQASLVGPMLLRWSVQSRFAVGAGESAAREALKRRCRIGASSEGVRFTGLVDRHQLPVRGVTRGIR